VVALHLCRQCEVADPATSTRLISRPTRCRAVNGTDLPASLRGRGGSRAIGGQKANLTDPVLVRLAMRAVLGPRCLAAALASQQGH
jgi:hypothetical protein